MARVAGAAWPGAREARPDRTSEDEDHRAGRRTQDATERRAEAAQAG